MKYFIGLVCVILYIHVATAQVTHRILPLGDSITWGCGSVSMPPTWPVACEPGCGGYRAPLYHMLRDTGFADSKGDATFTMVGTQSSGPTDIPAAQRSHEGHPGWTIPEINGISKNWLPLNATFILVHLGTNDVGQGHTLAQMITDMTTLLQTIKMGNPDATTIVGSIINMRANDTRAIFVGYNAALPGIVDAAAKGGQKVHFADVNRRSNWCVDTPASFPCTGVHPTTGGYAGMANAWFEVLADLMV